MLLPKKVICEEKKKCILKTRYTVEEAIRGQRVFCLFSSLNICNEYKNLKILGNRYTRFTTSFFQLLYAGKFLLKNVGKNQ